MYIVHVSIYVKPGDQDGFIEACRINAKASIEESGILRFDVLQDRNDENHFVLVEVYRTKEDTARHKETDHYKNWNLTVEDMMAKPRTKEIFEAIFPGENGWI